MRMSQADKDRTHARILGHAAGLLRERGLKGTSVADVMSEAGLTHGGFYKHFDSKDALIESALDAAFTDIVAMVERTDTLAAYQARYLSPVHVENPGRGCPVAALGQEVARESDALKATFGRGVQRIVAAVALRLRGSPTARRKAAIRQMCTLVGAVVVARASDPQTVAEVLAACREGQTNALSPVRKAKAADAQGGGR